MTTVNEQIPHILWHDATHSVFILDGPRSIADAQLLQSDHQLVSRPALQEPFQSQEPKSEAAKRRLLEHSDLSEAQRLYIELAKSALQLAAQQYVGPYCLPRVTRPEVAAQINSELPITTIFRPPQYDEMQSIDFEQVGQCTYAHNDYETTAIMHSRDDAAIAYLVPPGASLLLADLSDTQHIRAFHQAVKEDSPWRFDVMVMDPPWRNESASHTSQSYRVYDAYAMFNMISGMDLDHFMAKDCLVGIWITNKNAVRELVTGEGGFFDIWGVDLIEEWVWLKVTEHGEPTYTLDGIWRRPIETFLIGRRRPVHHFKPTTPLATQKRVLISVPDCHSRKPCLKSLMEKLLNLPTDYRGIEIFARNLVSDWWSVGNECLKYNASEHWERTS